MGGKEKAFGLKFNPAKRHLEVEPDINKLTSLLSRALIRMNPRKGETWAKGTLIGDEKKGPRGRVFLLSTGSSRTVLSGSQYPPPVVPDWIEMGQLTQINAITIFVLPEFICGLTANSKTLGYGFSHAGYHGSMCRNGITRVTPGSVLGEAMQYKKLKEKFQCKEEIGHK